MTASIAHTSVDCGDAYLLSEWWKQVLGYVDEADEPNVPGDRACMLVRPDGGHCLLLIEVPENKQGKNRLHFDLRPSAGTRDEELVRLRVLGAVEVADFRGVYRPETGWVILTGPEGNEFCILRSEAEVEAQAQGIPDQAYLIPRSSGTRLSRPYPGRDCGVGRLTRGDALQLSTESEMSP